jgi:transcriptional regulator with XRE-family HTH domain
MERTFPETLSVLRHERNISQRTAAAALHISQALLSHYENGAREPGLGFVCRACDYYGVTADYLLCRSEEPDAASSARRAAMSFLEQIRTVADRAEMALSEVEAGK